MIRRKEKISREKKEKRRDKRERGGDGG